MSSSAIVATIRVNGVAHDLRVVAVLPSTLNGRQVLLPHRYSRAGTLNNYLVRTTDPDDSQRVAADIRRLADRSLSGRGDDVSVPTAKAWIADDVAKQSSERRYLLIAILGLATLYMLIAMVNAVVIGAASRRAEFAIHRLTGLSRAQVVRMALWESMAVVVVGVVLGGIAAAFTIGGVAAGVSDVVGSRVFPLPWTMFGVLTLGCRRDHRSDQCADHPGSHQAVTDQGRSRQGIAEDPRLTSPEQWDMDPANEVAGLASESAPHRHVSAIAG